jgi:hypothetical protein
MDSLENTIIVMLTNKETGMFEKELETYKVGDKVKYIKSIFAQNEEGQIYIYMRISTESDVLDWQFSAIYDYYETVNYENNIHIEEDSECHNPTWVIKFRYEESQILIQEKIIEVLNVHTKELEDVFIAIENNKNEYL